MSNPFHKLALDPKVEALDIHHDARVRAVADAFFVVKCLDAEFDRASLDPGDDGACAQAHADRRCGVMADAEMRAEALMSGRQEVLDRVERGRLHHVDHHGGRKHMHPPAADARGGVLFADRDPGSAGEAFFQCGEVRHGIPWSRETFAPPIPTIMNGHGGVASNAGMIVDQPNIYAYCTA